tara:strand:- start:2729 stop:3091 length:363 start_codon:yes stop_codon:yes gene_type:complete
MYKIRGRIINFRTETINLKDGETAQKMFITIEESDTGFNHKHQFEIFGETKINLLKDKIKQDRFVKIDFYIKSNEWKDKFFNTLNIKNVILEDEVSMPDMSVYEEEDHQAEEEEKNKIPF